MHSQANPAADATDGEDLFKAEWGGGATLWLFGGEGQGFTRDTLAIAKRRLQISIDSRVESLNVGAAAAVCLFEQKRRRDKPRGQLERNSRLPANVKFGDICVQFASQARTVNDEVVLLRFGAQERIKVAMLSL